MTAIPQTSPKPFKPNSVPVYPGLSPDSQGWVCLNFKQDDIDKALSNLDLEFAKQCTYDVYGNKGLRTVTQLARIIDTIVTLNEKPLSPLHQSLGYTLQNAHALGCHMNTLAYNAIQTNPLNPNTQSQVALVTQKMIKIAEAYQAKGDPGGVERSLGTLVSTQGTPFVAKITEAVFAKKPVVLHMPQEI